eukprot:991489-Pelagomonas_calceolata.AAC.1
MGKVRLLVLDIALGGLIYVGPNIYEGAGFRHAALLRAIVRLDGDTADHRPYGAVYQRTPETATWGFHWSSPAMNFATAFKVVSPSPTANKKSSLPVDSSIIQNACYVRARSPTCNGTILSFIISPSYRQRSLLDHASSLWDALGRLYSTP